jgi:DNA repair protein RadC
VTLAPPALPPDARPRERLRRAGAAALAPTELLALLLGTGGPGRRAVRVAEGLLATFESLGRLSRAGVEELEQVPGVGPAKAAALVAAFELGRRAAIPEEARPVIRSAADAARWLVPAMGTLEREHFRVLVLNTRHEVLAAVDVAVGGLNAAAVHPRDVFTEAVRRRAAAVILAHNHPSGHPDPSPDDLALTRRLCEAGRIVGVDVLDHLVVGHGRYVSLRERGVL